MRVHPAVEALGFLLGTWSGTGRGRYPTVAPFAYREEVAFSHAGRPFLSYRQETFAEDDGRPLHAEVGYLRCAGRAVELVVAQPTGLVEVDEGTLEGTTLSLSSRLVGRTSSAKAVDQVRRTVRVDGDVLTYRLEMAAVGHRLGLHLEAELRRA
ncbi:MAG TPA: FABP family protein [Acidimicrobiales bacterium]|nr:FABP family protein [Acidimicrobiales bacterium]